MVGWVGPRAVFGMLELFFGGEEDAGSGSLMGRWGNWTEMTSHVWGETTKQVSEIACCKRGIGPHLSVSLNERSESRYQNAGFYDATSRYIVDQSNETCKSD